jgi:hypothetical protein
VVYTYNIMLFSLKKEGNPDTCCTMDKPWRHSGKWNKPVRKGQVLYSCIYMRYLQ